MKALLLVAVPVCATAALASCGVEREPGRVLNVVGDPASRTLELDTASCNQNAAADVDESASEIRIALTVDGVGSNAQPACDDLVRVALSEPLGDRQMFVNGDEVEVSSTQAS